MWYPLRIIVRVIPFRLVYLLGVAGGYLLYLISGEKHKIMTEELNLIIPNKKDFEIKRIIKKTFITYCTSEIEVLLYPVMNREFIKRTVTIVGKQHLDTALAKGNGVLLFQAHFGAFQMVMPAVGYSGYKMNQISAAASVWKEAGVSRIQKKSFDIKAGYESALPVQHISIKSSLRPVFRALERNEVVGITIDGGGGRKTVLIKFLGRNANFQQGAAEIAIRTDAEVIPAFIISEGGLKHRLVIHPPLKVNKILEKNEQARTIVQEFATILEDYVCRYPAHYGYTLYLRKSRTLQDTYPFFTDYSFSKNKGE